MFCMDLPCWRLSPFSFSNFFFKIPFPYIVAAAALGGLFLQQWKPHAFCKGSFDPQTRECSIEKEPANNQNNTRPSFAYVARVFIVCLGMWAVPVGVLWIWNGYNGALTQIGLFFTKAAFITLGGAYAVFSYITDVAVNRGWLTMEQMMIGLGLAESTPGPLIMVAQYVGFLGAWNLSGEMNPLTSGIIGALITTYVTFLP